jgi:hypothetical protein
MMSFRFPRLFTILLLITLLMSPAAASAYQDDPTPTPPPASSSASELPFSQADLVAYDGDVARPNGMVWLDDNLYVICEGDQTIYKLYGTSGVTDTYIYGITDAYAIYAEEQDNGEVHLWVPDYKIGALLRITPARVDTIASGMTGPWGIVYLDESTFLISSRLNGTVEFVTRTGEKIPLLQGLSLPTGLSRDDQYLYVANSGDPDRAVEWYPLPTSRSADESDEHLLVSGLARVMNIQVGPDNNLYISYEDDGTGVVGRIDPAECRENGGCTADQVERVITTNMEAPLAGLTFAPDGRLFLHQRYGETLYWMQIDLPSD